MITSISLRRRLARHTNVACQLIALFAAAALATGHLHAEAPPSPKRPKLIVAILVDQLRFDYMERFYDQFGSGGFRLLLDEGAWMAGAHYDYVPTITAPGHACFLSGSPPSINGIIGNGWFDRRTSKTVYCVEDPSVQSVGTDSGAGKMSPRNFIGATFADQLRLHYQSKVVGISIKDRGAILPAGKKPAGAYWFEPSSGNFITSSYYVPALPEWVAQFNARKRPKDFEGAKWERLLDPKYYIWPDDAPGEGHLAGEKTSTFDHTVASNGGKHFDPIIPTPFGNQLLLEFAKAAIEGEHLGEGPQPDLLTVSFSSIDYCGHTFGPYSQEVQDITLRLDRQLADLFTYLDKRMGLANVEIILTADHGVAPTPAFAVQQGLDGGRVDDMQMMGDLQAKLSERFDTPNILLSRRFYDGNLFLNKDALREKHLTVSEVTDFIRDWALDTGKIEACYSRDQLLEGRVQGELGRRVANGFNAERSGDIVIIYKPFLMSVGETGTTHGSPYTYDTHVPVFLYGSAFLPGRYFDEFYVTDIVPTMCAGLHMMEPPGCTGKPFVKVLAEEGPRKKAE